MNENKSADDRVVISDQPVADFSHLTAPEQLAAISRIEHVALVIVPESLAAAYAAIPSSRVASTVYVPDGAPVRVHTGALVAGGDGIGAADDVLIITGMLIITSPVTGPVPRQIHVVGSVLAPRGSEAGLGPALAGVTGQVSYYTPTDGQDIKVHTGQVRLSGALLANPGGQADDILIAAGQVVITGEVTQVGYRQVIIAGQLAAPAASRDVIEPRAQLQGQAAWYRGDDPRVFYNETSLGPDFFRVLAQPVSLVVLGRPDHYRRRHRGHDAGEDHRHFRVRRRYRATWARRGAASAHHRRVRAYPGRRWTGKLSSAASTRRTAPRCTLTSPAGPATRSRPPTLCRTFSCGYGSTWRS